VSSHYLQTAGWTGANYLFGGVLLGCEVVASRDESLQASIAIKEAEERHFS